MLNGSHSASYVSLARTFFWIVEVGNIRCDATRFPTYVICTHSYGQIWLLNATPLCIFDVYVNIIPRIRWVSCVARLNYVERTAKKQDINIGDTPFQAGVEGAVWVEYAHPTQLGHREGIDDGRWWKSKHIYLGVGMAWELCHLIGNLVWDDATWNLERHRGKENEQTK